MSRLRIEKLGKCYKVYPRPGHRLQEWALLGRVRRHEQHWALRGVSLDIAPGEAVGVLGNNGAGKSTLLKLIKGTLRPTEGRIEVEGRLAALELALGFHDDFSGRENLFMSGSLLRLSTEQIQQLLPEIEDFAEIGAAIDDPVRTYSTGMRMRLGFSLATAIRPDVLLVDEALAVGDTYFQQKCMMRIRSFRELGTTLLLASHDPRSVKTLCDRAILLDRGVVIRSGAPSDVFDYYNAMIARQEHDHEIRQVEGAGRKTLRSGDSRAAIDHVEVLDEAGPTRAVPVGEPLVIRVEGHAEEPVDDLTVGISIRDRVGNEIFGSNTHHLGFERLPVDAQTPFVAEFRMPVNLGAGSYTLTVALHAGEVHLEGSYDWWDQVLVFQVIPGGEPGFAGSSYLPVEAAVSVAGRPIEPSSGHRNGL